MEKEVGSMRIECENQIIALLADLMKCPKKTFDIGAPWAGQGIDSLIGLRLIGKLSDLTGEELDPLLILDCSCISELAEHLDPYEISTNEKKLTEEREAREEEARCY
jgi:hypothetical protein